MATHTRYRISYGFGKAPRFYVIRCIEQPWMQAHPVEEQQPLALSGWGHWLGLLAAIGLIVWAVFLTWLVPLIVSWLP